MSAVFGTDSAVICIWWCDVSWVLASFHNTGLKYINFGLAHIFSFTKTSRLYSGGPSILTIPTVTQSQTFLNQEFDFCRWQAFSLWRVAIGCIYNSSFDVYEILSNTIGSWSHTINLSISNSTKSFLKILLLVEYPPLIDHLQHNRRNNKTVNYVDRLAYVSQIHIVWVLSLALNIK